MPAPGGRVEDQIVRTDLHELYERDLQGKALAYTPFCDSRKETEGFRYAADTLLPGALFSPPCIVSFFLGFFLLESIAECGVSWASPATASPTGSGSRAIGTTTSVGHPITSARCTSSTSSGVSIYARCFWQILRSTFFFLLDWRLEALASPNLHY